MANETTIDNSVTTPVAPVAPAVVAPVAPISIAGEVAKTLTATLVNVQAEMVSATQTAAATTIAVQKLAAGMAGAQVEAINKGIGEAEKVLQVAIEKGLSDAERILNATTSTVSGVGSSALKLVAKMLTK
jgi:hypothetical protein